MSSKARQIYCLASVSVSNIRGARLKVCLKTADLARMRICSGHRSVAPGFYSVTSLFRVVLISEKLGLLSRRSRHVCIQVQDRDRRSISTLSRATQSRMTVALQFDTKSSSILERTGSERKLWREGTSTSVPSDSEVFEAGEKMDCTTNEA
jgi:hypothetical protein